VRRLAAGFRKAGLKTGDVVCMHAFNDVRFPSPSKECWGQELGILCRNIAKTAATSKLGIILIVFLDILLHGLFRHRGSWYESNDMGDDQPI